MSNEMSEFMAPIYRPFQRHRDRQFFKSETWLRWKNWCEDHPTFSLEDTRKLAESDARVWLLYNDLLRAELRRRGVRR